MKKGTPPIILGCVLIFLQILSWIGAAKTGGQVFYLSFESLPLFFYALLNTLGYNAVGLFGLFAVCFGVRENKAGDTKPENENKSKTVIATAEQAKAAQHIKTETPNNTHAAWLYCPQCGGAWDQKGDKCLICNHLLTSVNPPLRFCPDCGTYLEEDGSCPVCGHTVLDK